MEDAEFKRKADKAFALMAEKGLCKTTRIPFIYRMLWSLGIKAPPALFASFGSNLCILGVYYAVVYGCIMWFFSWHPRGMIPLTGLITSLITGLFYGACMAIVYRKRRKGSGLPEWEQL